jgi:hypothetical protein
MIVPEEQALIKTAGRIYRGDEWFLIIPQLSPLIREVRWTGAVMPLGFTIRTAIYLFIGTLNMYSKFASIHSLVSCAAYFLLSHPKGYEFGPSSIIYCLILCCL